MTRGTLSSFLLIIVILISACSTPTSPQKSSESPSPNTTPPLPSTALMPTPMLTTPATTSPAPSVPKNKAYSITWEDDIQLTNTDAAAIYPTLGLNGSTVHLAWVDQRHGGENREIYYNRSIDNGVTWQTSDTRISNNPLLSIKDDLAVKGNTVHLFWRDSRDGNFEEYLVQSKDGGVSWGSETRLTNDPAFSGCPFPSVIGNTLNLFWRDDRSGTLKIYQKRSVDAGANWSPDILLTPDGIQSEFPFPAISGNTIHLVWRDTRDGNSEIYYKRSMDAGATWTADENLTKNPSESEHPKIVAQGDTLYVVWRDNRDGKYEIYYKRSTDGGQSWSTDRKLTHGAGRSYWPVLAVSNDLLHLLWCDDRSGTQALYYAFSNDKGDSWSAEARLSECVLPLGEELMGAHPIMATESYVHVVFNDDRTGVNKIYYKRASISLQ
ncbi:MAG: sialidase family protein [Chloroflexota bacterium]